MEHHHRRNDQRRLIDASIHLRNLEYMKAFQKKRVNDQSLRAAFQTLESQWRPNECKAWEMQLKECNDPAVRGESLRSLAPDSSLSNSHTILMVYPGWYVLRSNVLSLKAIYRILTFVEGEEGGAPFVKRMKRTCVAAPCTPPPHAGKEATLQNLKGWDRARVALIAAWIKNEKRGRKRPQTIMKACNAFNVGQFHEPLCSV